MRILITGSSGQVATEIARQLSHRHETIGVDIIPGEWTPSCIEEEHLFDQGRQASELLDNRDL